MIVRRKKFPVMPMDEIEAVEQMNLLGHDAFFVFYNADTSRITVLYAGAMVPTGSWSRR